MIECISSHYFFDSPINFILKQYQMFGSYSAVFISATIKHTNYLYSKNVNNYNINVVSMASLYNKLL